MARCLALLGMVATHVLDERDASGDLTFAQSLAGGRSAALFAVLAGVSVALVSGRREPVRGRERLAVSGGLAVRALLIALLGLLLATLDTGIAVILTYYGLLFVLALPFLGLRAPALAALTVVWVVGAPLLSQWLRPMLPDRGFANPMFDQLDEPTRLLSELAFTGYYPVVPWLAYLLAGMALGRADLSSRRLQAAVTLGGAALAVGASYLSGRLTSRRDVADSLVESWPGPEGSGPELLDTIGSGMFGNTPAGGDWAWLLVVAPHSTTPFDLAQTIGSALLVIGLALLVVGSLPAVGTRFVQVLFGAGAMTLTLYSLHVVMRTEQVPPAERPEAFVWHVLVLGGIGLAYAAARRPGPLEAAVRTASSAAAGSVRRSG